MLKIKIGSESYSVKFGYGATRLLGELWQVEGLMEVFQKVISVVANDEEDADNLSDEEVAAEFLKFKNLQIIGEVAWAGIQNAGYEDEEIDVDEILEVLCQEFTLIGPIFSGFLASMPKAKDEKPKSAGKQKPKTGSKK